ncbi:hypothetical protein G6F37_007677 [Rhizopus arrhizus]|nr:hypothetical protein G6F38_006843 [Rhizopus arrhizus]KAG1156370.1 hypothetical protein G6F37_007677 [Rhizopus arrhizus]
MLDMQTTESLWHDNSHSTEEYTVPPELLQSLRQHALFQRTNNESFLQKITCSMHLRTYGTRDIIIVEGEPARAMFFLLKGSVDVCSADFERIYANLPQGSCFGEIGILYSMPRTATVIARSRCIVASLTAEEVNNILPHYPEVERMLRFEAEERLAVLNKSKSLKTADKISLKPLTERNIEDCTGTHQLLQKIPYFQGCPEEFLHLVSLKVEPRHYAPNAIIIKKGEYGNELIFIISGTVEFTKPIKGDSEDAVPITRLGPGDYFGDISVLLNTPRATDARAVTALELYILKKSDFIQVLDHFPSLLDHFKSMAESSLNQLKSMTDMDVVMETADTPISPLIHQEPSPEGPSLTIPPSSVCSTTTDQDPTLLPPTAANVLKNTETRRRRASVAIWSDPNLVALANRNLKPSQETSKMSIESVIQPLDSKPFQPKTSSWLGLLNEDTLSRIVNYLDLNSILRLSTVSKKCREFIQQNDKIFTLLDLSQINKKVTDSNIKHIVRLVGHCHPRHLNLSQCFYLTDDGFKELVGNMSHIETMDLNSCWLLTDKSLGLLATACPQLTRLDLSNCRKISDIGIFRLLDEKASRDYPTLKELSLSYCKKLSDMTMQHLAHYCSSTLEYLNIQRCTRITDQGFSTWTETRFPLLKFLNLNDCSFLTDQAIAYLVYAAPHLNHLSLSFCCALSDSAIERLAVLQELHDLDVSFCGAAVSDLSVRTLLSSKSVFLLNIRGCVRVTDSAVQSILELGRLKTLNISQCPGISTNAKEIIRGSEKLQQLIA